MATAEIPFFSICVPNFNYSGYLPITIESVLAQGFGDFEIVVVDNASTDDSWSVIEKLAQHEKRIRSFRNAYNIGFAPNLQRATMHARGKYIILLSSDDVMLPNALQTYYDVLKDIATPSAVVLHSAFDQIDSNGKRIKTAMRAPGRFDGELISSDTTSPKFPFRIESQNPLEAVRFALNTNKGIAAFLTVCYSRELWEAVEGYDTQYFIFPDKAFLLKILLREPAFLYINKVLFGYRIHGNNQNAKNAGQAALKHQVDGYMRVINFNEADLRKISMTRPELEHTFVNNLCVRPAYSALRLNHWLKAFKILCFAYASFPKVAIRSGKLWMLKFLLLGGPLSVFLLQQVRNRTTHVE